MQLASIHHMEQLKAEIRGHIARQADDSDRAQIMIRKLGELAQEGRKVATKREYSRVLSSTNGSGGSTTFTKLTRTLLIGFWKTPRTLPYHAQASNTACKIKTVSIGISGKAGSGKSTLMKFLVRNQSVKDYLRDWAGPAEPVLIPWFIWAAGSPMQKSQEGLFQSLLF